MIFATGNGKKTRSLENIDMELMELKKKLSSVAMKLWQKWLQVQPIAFSQNDRQLMASFVAAINLLENGAVPQNIVSQFNSVQSKFSQYLPCWAVTALSAKGKVPFQAGMFDIVVFDEASQCDIASALPLLFRSKRAVIIGDPKQLSHITSISKQQDMQLLSKYNIGFQWSYSGASLFDLAQGKADNENIIHLRDHHRSHEDIIEYSNREFYDGHLRIATRYDRLKIPINEKPGIRWKNVVGKTIKPQTGGVYNVIEAEAIVKEIRNLIYDAKYKGTIGVVTPFRLQADLIRNTIAKEAALQDLLMFDHDFLADTVNKFQGDERDIILFSPVISQGVQNNAIMFFQKTGNLFNVALTRARAMLIVIGDNATCRTCGVPHLEHFVSYVDALEKKVPTVVSEIELANSRYPHVSNSEDVSKWEKHFYTALFNNGIKVIPQYPVDRYRLDFALFLGEHRLDIEVDGEMYHKDWNGELCYSDQLRNQRLIELGWNVQRFWVQQIRDELPACIDTIELWIRNHS